MDDLRGNLTALAERGTPIGADEMIDRVEAAMGGDTVVVVNEPGTAGRPRRLRSATWFTAAAVSVIAMAGIYWAVADSQIYFDSAGTVPGTPEALFPERMATIEAMVAARNAGDFEVYRSYFSEDPILFHSWAGSDQDWEGERSFMAAGEVWELTGSCEIRGRSLIGCPLLATNDFMAPAGIRIRMPALLIGFDDEGAIRSIGANAQEVAGSPQAYIAAFDAWLEQAHPDVHASFGPRVGEVESTWGEMPNSADMPTALEYVDEFLEYSDVYPLSD